MDLKFQMQAKIQKPLEEVFEAVYDPKKLSQYFTTAGASGYNTRVVMNFESLDPRSTLIKISESGWKETQEGLESSYGNCHGWTQMICCLKAYLEYAINLRKGYF